MNNEEFKEIISKSTIETSDDFITTLMSTIEVSQEVEKTSSWWSYRPVIITCTILIVIITHILYTLLRADSSLLKFLADIPKTPIFIFVILLSLYGINNIIKLNENQILQKGIENMVSESDSFAFLHDEEDLYDESDLKEK
jgi:TRAP-type C4-dicarboxylate transport system permease small subunit